MNKSNNGQVKNIGRSESDNFEPELSNSKPTDDELNELAHSWDGHFGDTDGYEDGAWGLWHICLFGSF